MIRYPNDKFYFIGDSAGGGLVVSMLEHLREMGIKVDKTILLSPWIDISMSNPDIETQLKKDFTLNLDSLIESGKRYAGNLKTTDGKVSPLYSNLDNLGEFLIYASDNELLYPDIIKFSESINKSTNTSSTLIIGKDLCHDYHLLIIKETKGIIKEMMEFLLK